MDGIINVKVGGNHVSKDSKNAGVRGEANVTILRITFDEGWKPYAKTVTFFDAQGKNPVKRVETVDLIEDITKDTLTYLTPIPKEALTLAGEITFIIDGYSDGKRKRSVEDKLYVKDSPDTDNAGEPTDPMPEIWEQFQEQIDGIIDTIKDATRAERNAIVSAGEAKASELNVHEYMQASLEAMGKAKSASDKAVEAVGKTSYIGLNGNWFAWDSETGAFYDTMIKAQAGSTVYVGDNPPDDADVWVDPDGEGCESEVVLNDYEGNKAYGDYSLASGRQTTAGTKGYYYSSIVIGEELLDENGNSTNTYGSCVITLSKEQGKASEPFDIAWKVGDTISVYYTIRYHDCSIITKIDKNVITVDKLPFNSSEINVTENTSVNDYSATNSFKPSLGYNNFSNYTHAEGNGTMALGKASHAEGEGTRAVGHYAHAEGGNTTAFYCAHAEGEQTRAEGNASHSEGKVTKALGHGAHAEGYYSTASGNYSHASGYGTTALGDNSYTEGQYTVANGINSHAEGTVTTANGLGAHAEGRNTFANGTYSHAEGQESVADGERSHAEGYKTSASGQSSHAEGQQSKANGSYSHAEGFNCSANGNASHSEGQSCVANDYSHAEGFGSQALGSYAHAEGQTTTANGACSHTEGRNTSTDANATYAHSEGFGTVARGSASHAEGQNTQANGACSHSEGFLTQANGMRSHAEGSSTVAEGHYSHAEGGGTIASGQYQHVQGKFNQAHPYMAHIVGGGTSDTDRKNIHTLDWNGGAWFKGDITVGDRNLKVATEEFVNGKLSSGSANTQQNAIQLSNGIRIESREDGVWLVDGDEETQLYDSQSQQIQAQYSDFANEADYAFYDTSGRELKGTSIQEYGDGSGCYVVLEDGQIASFDTVSGSFEWEFPEELYLGYTSKLFFTTSSSGFVFVDMNHPVYFRGDSTENGAIIIEQDTRYTIAFEYDGYNLIGSVSAVPVGWN